MTVTYWDRGEYACGAESRAIEPTGTIHVHARTDAEAITAVRRMNREWHCGARNVDPWTSGECLWRDLGGCHWHADRRYHCVTGPGGLVRGVTP